MERSRDRLLAEPPPPPPSLPLHKPMNTKRRGPSSSAVAPRSGRSPRLSIQDFVRSDPGYTADIQHLVFLDHRGRGGTSGGTGPGGGGGERASPKRERARSRLAEMFALSRHLQQRSVERETKHRGKSINRSLDSAISGHQATAPATSACPAPQQQPAPPPPSSSAPVAVSEGPPEPRRRAEEPVRRSATAASATARLSPAGDAERVDMSTARGPNVSILHLRSTSEPWETSPTNPYPSNPPPPRLYSSARTPGISKHGSLGSHREEPSSYHQGSIQGGASGELFVTGGCGRELSPVRWCDREVDGVYLGRSGWVQVQQRSLDESRRSAYCTAGSCSSTITPINSITSITTSRSSEHGGSLPTSRRGVPRLADYHCNSAPGPCVGEGVPQRPAYLPLRRHNTSSASASASASPSPRSSAAVPLPLSPPPVTPIISPPPAFQDRARPGRGGLLARCDAIQDSDPGSPPNTPPFNRRRPRTTPSPVSLPAPRLPQARSLEEPAGASGRRSQFVQRYRDSSSSSSSSLGFRSLDSCVSRPAMPRLPEHDDVQDQDEADADEEDNNSLSLAPTVARRREVASPSSSSSSGSASWFKDASPYPARSPLGAYTRRGGPRGSTGWQDEQQRVRRSRSLQLPEKRSPMSSGAPGGPGGAPLRLSPGQQHHRRTSPGSSGAMTLDGDIGVPYAEQLVREAELVTEYLYGSRSRAAAQALLLQRYRERREENHIQGSRDRREENQVQGSRDRREGSSPQPKEQQGKTPPNGYNIYYIPSTTRNRKSSPSSNPCNSATCDFWPHCAHRDALTTPLRPSPNYAPRPTIRRPPEISGAPVHPPVQGISISSGSSSSSDVWLHRNMAGVPAAVAKEETRAPRVPRAAQAREMIPTRPGSAPVEVEPPAKPLGECQQRSMSLPKSFLSGSKHRAQFPCKKQDEGYVPTPSPRHRPPTPEVAHTAPVTPSRDVATDRRRPQGLGADKPTETAAARAAVRRSKASSTPHLLDSVGWESNSRKVSSEDCSSNENITQTPPTQESPKEVADEIQKSVSGKESVLDKFRKTFSLRSNKKGPKDCVTSDCDDSSLDQLTVVENTAKDNVEHKYRFGPLVWRTSKENKSNKAARSTKCRSRDSGIQIEMVSGVAGSGTGGDSSADDPDVDVEADLSDIPVTDVRHAADNSVARDLGESRRRRRWERTLDRISGAEHGAGRGTEGVEKEAGEVRRRGRGAGKSRPLSDADGGTQDRQADVHTGPERHEPVRRAHSDLGGQRLYHWDVRNAYGRVMSNRPHRLSPRRRPPDAPGSVQLRSPQRRNGKGGLRRSLSQPLDMDKMGAYLRTKTTGHMAVSEDEHDGRTSDDETLSDSESSVASVTERKKSLDLAVDEDMVILAEAVFDHVAIEAEELAFRAGSVIEVLETVNRDWWWGSTGGQTGWFPAAFVRLRVSQEDTVEDCLAAMASGKPTTIQHRRRTSISLLSNEQVRTSVVREIVNTERDFVKVLTDLVEGYIAECKKRRDMFTPEQIQTVFMNLEEMLVFQRAFLRDLEGCIDWDAPYRSCIGECFLKHSSGFRMYSDYCNHHPMATATLQELCQFNNYSKFFEACRLMRGLIEIPLDGYLLTPVQRICKYPLQLAELLKYTKLDHADYDKIKEALAAMRDVAMLINESKRRMESLEKLAAWQQRVEGWEGEDLIEVSSQLIHQGEVIRVTSGMWTNHLTLFLFDRQVIYCKKDILKRNTFTYKGRICLDTSQIVSLPDGKDPLLGVSLRHALKVYSCSRDKWLVFCCRSASDKQQWLEAFEQERRLVVQDHDDNFEFAPTAKKLARIAARCQKRPPHKPRAGEKKFKRDSAYMGSTLAISSHASNSLGRRMGTWFTFGHSKKTRGHDQAS